VFEFGACHYKLGMNPETVRSRPRRFFAEDDYLTVLIAGEIMIDTSQNRLYFNFESGTFTAKMGLDAYPRYSELLTQIVKNVLGYTPEDARPFNTVQYTPEVLLPADLFPTLAEIREECAERDEFGERLNNIFVQYRGSRANVDFCDEADEFPTLDRAQAYFSRNPYEYVQLVFGGKKYHNPDRTKPADFLVIDESFPSFGRKKSMTKTAKPGKRKVKKSARVSKKSMRKHK
jgi:hypothetical protein